MQFHHVAAIVLAVLMPLVPAAVSAAPKNDTAVTASNKKPGQACGNLARGSDAYKQCIQQQAHTGQKPKKP
ncbi:MAG TPA: hypothetical protein VJN67_12755 [Stellaceae bacterium]|nr:hypothetical protein [Stellaceae bacterium]